MLVFLRVIHFQIHFRAYSYCSPKRSTKLLHGPAQVSPPGKLFFLLMTGYIFFVLKLDVVNSFLFFVVICNLSVCLC